MSALEQVARLKAGTGSPAFPNIDRAQLAIELNNRLLDASRINQAAASLCGPASFLYSLARDRPGIYAEYIVDLFETGTGKIGSLEIKPGSDCRRFKPNGKITSADWIGLASLRDSENSIFDYESCDNKAGGITMPHSMASWFRAAGYRIVNNKTNVFFTKGESSIREMITLFNQGHRVCVFINAQLLDDHSVGDTSVIPNHWTTLESATIKDGQACMTLWCWGKKNKVPSSGMVNIGPFTNNVYGYVSALG